MNDRITAEVQLLRQRFKNVEQDANDEWILIHDFPLPAGRYNMPSTRVLFRLPTGYPMTAPDDFFVERGVRLKDNALPAGMSENNSSSSGPAPLSGDWSWFSWHPETWRPSARVDAGDNLLSFTRSINQCLRGE